MSVVEWIGAALMLSGAAFAFTGAVGLFRMPDFFTRTHAASITDTAGAGFILLGLALYGGGDAATNIRLILILLFILFTGPTASTALARAALNDGLKPVLRSEVR